MVNIDPETCWHEGLGSALELMGFVYDFSGTEAGIQLPAALAENVFKDMAEAATRIKDNILLRGEPHQLGAGRIRAVQASREEFDNSTRK